jgi:hypothetical protein
MTQEQVLEILSNYDSLVQRAREVARKLSTLRQKLCQTDEKVVIDEKWVEFSWEEYSMGCFMGTDFFDFPTEYLWRDDFLELEQLKLEEDRLFQEKIRLEMENKERVRKEEQEIWIMSA